MSFDNSSKALVASLTLIYISTFTDLYHPLQKSSCKQKLKVLVGVRWLGLESQLLSFLDVSVTLNKLLQTLRAVVTSPVKLIIEHQYLRLNELTQSS